MTADELRALLARHCRQLAEALSDSQPHDLPPTQAQIYRHLTDTPQRGKELAVKCGRRYTSNFRVALAALVNAGHARRITRGYVRS